MNREAILADGLFLIEKVKGCGYKLSAASSGAWLSVKKDNSSKKAKSAFSSQFLFSLQADQGACAFVLIFQLIFISKFIILSSSVAEYAFFR